MLRIHELAEAGMMMLKAKHDIPEEKQKLLNKFNTEVQFTKPTMKIAFLSKTVKILDLNQEIYCLASFESLNQRFDPIHLVLRFRSLSLWADIFAVALNRDVALFWLK